MLVYIDLLRDRESYVVAIPFEMKEAVTLPLIDYVIQEG